MRISSVLYVFHAPTISCIYNGLNLHNFYTCTHESVVYKSCTRDIPIVYIQRINPIQSGRVNHTNTKLYDYIVFILRPEYWTVGVTPTLEVVGLNPREILQLQHPGKECQFELSEFYSDFFVKMRQFL
jgi:hypothetical protein